MKSIISFSVILLLLIACKKNKTITIEGILMEDCSTPAANVQGMIYEHDYSNEILSDDVWVDFTTDENGYFKVKTKENVKLKINLKNNFDRVLSEIDIGDSDLNLGKIYYNKFPTKFKIKLDVSNSYTVNDTLVIVDYDNLGNSPVNYKYYPGPFSSGVLDTVHHYMFNGFPIKFNDFITYGAPEITFSYRVRSLPSFNNHDYTSFHLAPICSNEYGEVTLEIE